MFLIAGVFGIFKCMALIKIVIGWVTFWKVQSESFDENTKEFEDQND